MALKFSPSFAELMAYNGIKMAMMSNVQFCCISLHAGPKPTADDIIANWTSYNAAAANTLWIGGGFAYATSGGTVYASTIGPATVPLHNGVATWGIIWPYVGGPTAAPFNTTTVQSSYRKFIVGDVSVAGGTGMIRVADTNIAIANGAMQIVDAGLTISMG